MFYKYLIINYLCCFVSVLHCADLIYIMPNFVGIVKDVVEN